MVFLVKSKVILKFLDNCRNIPENDVLRKHPNNLRRKELKSKITYVFSGEKKNCSEEYQKVGRNIQRFFFSLLKANGIKINFKESLNRVNDPNYYENAIDIKKISEVESKLKTMDPKNLLSPIAILNFLGASFNEEVPDHSDLHFCFPDPEFLYMYYRLFDSRVGTLALSLVSEPVTCFKKFYIPLEIFEGELKNNNLFSTRVRLLKNLDFLNKINPDFLVQKEFILKKSMKKSLSEKYLSHFRKSLSDYIPFDRNEINSKIIKLLI